MTPYFVTNSAKPAFSFYQYAGIFDVKESEVYFGEFDTEISKYEPKGNRFWVMQCKYEADKERCFEGTAEEMNFEIVEKYIKNNTCLFLMNN